MGKIKVLNKSELLINHSKVVNVNNTEIAVFNVEGEYFAINDRCSHAEASLSEGEVYDCKVEWPLHGAEFDLKTGESLTPPASKAVVCYQISTDEESIYIELDDFNSNYDGQVHVSNTNLSNKKIDKLPSY